MADYTGSDIPSEGLISNVATLDGGYDSANFAFSVEAHDPALIDVGVYVDGELVSRLHSDETRGSVAGLSPGDHTLDIVPLVIGDRQYARHGNPQGNRVYLDWPASTSPDCAAYKITLGAAIVGTVTERVVYPMDRHRTAAGGRVTVFGSPAAAETVNGSLTVACAGGIATFDGLPYTIQKGVTTSLPYGIRVTWHDDPGEYADFEIFVGIRSDFTSRAMEPGTYTFSIVATDAAGNPSGALSRTVRVLAIPPALAVTANGALNVSGDTTIDRVNIYSNYNRALDVISAQIETRYPTNVLTMFIELNGVRDFRLPGFSQLLLPVGARFYARPVSGTTEREDLVIHTVTDPAVPVIVFGTIGGVTMTPAAEGNMLLTWNYRPAENDGATSFKITHGEFPESWAILVSYPASSGVGYPVLVFSDVLLMMGFQTGDVAYAQVTAMSGAVAGPMSEVVSAIADATAPVLTGALGGAAT